MYYCSILIMMSIYIVTMLFYLFRTEPVALCCGMLKNFPDMIPGVTWGSMSSEPNKAKWTQNNCDNVVGGRTKAHCSATGLC